jgi:hypothetical protein
MAIVPLTGRTGRWGIVIAGSAGKEAAAEICGVLSQKKSEDRGAASLLPVRGKNHGGWRARHGGPQGFARRPGIAGRRRAWRIHLGGARPSPRGDLAADRWHRADIGRCSTLDLDALLEGV